MNISCMVNQSTDSANAETALHTGMLDQYDRLRKLNAFLEKYEKEKIFENALEDFDDSLRCVLFLLSVGGIDTFYCWIS
ncbi:hypothetical protein JB92DRAFT_711793 [Gautieria morchelliformis]|nr:hypothetical protein JB92DRAFT_711793 [Gautieria morchelliformis]